MNKAKCKGILLKTLIVAALVVFMGCTTSQEDTDNSASATKPGSKAKSDENKQIKIGLLLETYDVARWARDEEYFVKRAKELGAEVIIAVANADQDKQNQQADSMLTQGVDVLVVVPKNLKTAARIISSAHEKNVPVLAYDRLIMNCDLDMYISFDNVRVGYLQATGILKVVPEGNYILLGGAFSDNNAHLFRKGQLDAIADYEKKSGKKVNVLGDPFLDNWDTEEARRKISNLLTRFRAEGKEVQAIVASNDSTAGGVIAALKAEGLDGKVAVSGQDSELGACQRIVEGTQTLTIYKPIRALATNAAEVAVRLAGGESPEDIIKALGMEIQHLDNKQIQVPSVFLDPMAVTSENMAETVIAEGWHPVEKVYANIPKDRWPQ